MRAMLRLLVALCVGICLVGGYGTGGITKISTITSNSSMLAFQLAPPYVAFVKSDGYYVTVCSI